MKADNQRAVEAGIAAWLKRGLCTTALLPRVTGITIQQIPNFWFLRRAFIDFWIVRWPWNVTEAQQRQQYLLGFAESLSYKFQTRIPLCPSQQRGIPSHRIPVQQVRGGFWCLARAISAWRSLHSFSPPHSHAGISTRSDISGWKVLAPFQGVLLLGSLLRPVFLSSLELYHRTTWPETSYLGWWVKLLIRLH